MKNFTKQNFKTNPLWIRLLIMAFMLLLGSSSAWAQDMYVAGSMTNWATNQVKLSTSSSTYSGYYYATFTVEAGTYEYKIKESGNNWWCSTYNKTNSNGVTYSIRSSNCDNIKITVASKGTLEIYHNKSNDNTFARFYVPCTPPILNLSKPSADANKGDDVNLTTLSGATASSGTVEWYTTTTSTTATSASVTVSETKTYYARAVGDCKSDAKSFKINAKCTKDFYLVGASADIFGSVWTPAQTANKMNCDLNSLTKTYTNITVAANTTIEYKITDSNGWQGAQYPSSGNASFEIKTAGKYNITFTAQTDGLKITGTPKVEWELACNDLPNDAYSIKEANKTAEWTGSNITPIITKSNNEYPNPTVTYNGKSALPKDVGLYTVKATVSGDDTYCDEEFDLGTFTITCPTLTAPTVSVNQHIVKCGTDFTQKGKITISGLVTGNTYTYKVGDNGTAQSLTFTGTSVTLSNLVTGGKYIVTASNGCDTQSADATVNVTTNTKATLSWDVPAKGFLVADETIEATLSPAAAGSIAYSTSAPSVIAVVDNELTAQPNKNGTANITATPSLNSGYCGATAITENNVPVKYFNVAGTANLCGDAWNTTANPMTYNNGVWSKTFEAKPAAEYQFKVTKEFWPQIAETPIVDNSNGNLTCTVKRITNSKGETYDNIFFTTPTKGNITIKYTEANGAYVEFEPICLEDIDIEAVSADKDQYNYNEIAKLSIADATIDAAYGSVYSISYQWQEKNGDEYTDIQGATGKTYQAEDLEVGNHTYRVAVTYSYTGFGKNCTNTKESEPTTVNVICPSPEVPKFEVTQHEVVCGNTNIQKGIIKITNPVAGYKYRLGNEVNTEYTLDANNSIPGIDGGTKYRISAVRYCGTAKSSTTNEEEYAEISKTDVKLTPTLTSTPIVKCGEGDNAYTPGTLVITNYNADYNYAITPSVGTPTIDGTNATYSINSQTATEYTVTATHNTYNTCSTPASITVALTDNTPTLEEISISSNVQIVCAGDNNVTLTCNLVNPVGTPSYKWFKNGVEIVGETSNLIPAGTLNENTTFSVAVILDNNGCTKEFNAEKLIEVKVRPDAPKFNPNYMTVCQGEAFTLPGSEVEGYIWSDALGKPTTANKPNGIDATTDYYAVISFGCPSDATLYTVNVNPLPTITLTADNETVNVSKTVTLSVSGSDFAELKWSATDGTKSYTVTPGENNTATITTDENALITVTVVAKSVAGCETSASIDLTFGSEDCENANADYIEILCRRTDNPGSTDADRDMHCYAWDPNTNKTYLGGWPGVKTDDGDFEYQGKKYAVWQIKTNSDIYIIFSNGNDSQKTGDIKGPNDAGLKKGYRYVYTLSSDYKTATLYEEPSKIFAPEVKTLSATCARQSDNSLKVTVTGKIMKKGCVEISSYGFQYKKDGGDYTNDDVCSSDCDQDAGFIFTKDITLAAGKYGEYTFRARLINENSSKVYGEKITIYYSESDVLIAAVGEDEIVTNKSGVYYDFVGLYVKNVMLPEGAKVKSYKWYKGDAVYNSGNVTVADRGVSAANNNIRPSEEGAYKCVVTLDNNQTLTSNVINVTATNTYNDKVNASNRNLPVISVRTNEAFPTCVTAGTEGKYPSTNIEGWKEKRSVDVKIFNADGTLYYDRKARMNYRGSSSLNFNKKSYAFCPGAADCGNDKGPDYVETKKMNLFGLSKGAEDKDWVLYAAAADPTLMRNRLVFDTYKTMRGSGAWGVDSKYVELVIDGVYQGVYVLMDKITNNEKRVYVGTYGDDEKKDYNGGFIVKFDKTDVADRERNLVAGQEIGDEKTFRTVRTGRTDVYTYGTLVDQLFEIEYPEKKDVEKAGASWSTTLNAIKQRFQDFEDALEKGEFLKVRSIIDYKSWADWFIINEFTKNLDAYRASCVFICKGEGQKIEALPLWDQELSFNNGAANIAGKGADKTNGLLIENDGVYKDCFPAPFWFTGRVSNFNNCGEDLGESSENPRLEYYLLKDECFIQTIKERWKIHIAEDGALHKKTLTTKVGVLLAELGAAKDRETTKWPSNHRVNAACGSELRTGYNNVGFDASKGTLDSWVGGELNADATSESSSNSRVTNLNYLINQMQGDPLQFNLVLNPGNGVTTPWVPVTLTVEAPAGYDYTYDDSEVEAAEGVIIKKLGNDAYSYTFPRPEAWGTGNDANASDPRDPRLYEINVSLNVEVIDNTCGSVDTEKHATITLEDEGDDNCSYTDK